MFPLLTMINVFFGKQESSGKVACLGDQCDTVLNYKLPDLTYTKWAYSRISEQIPKSFHRLKRLDGGLSIKDKVICPLNNWDPGACFSKVQKTLQAEKP